MSIDDIIRTQSPSNFFFYNTYPSGISSFEQLMLTVPDTGKLLIHSIMLSWYGNNANAAANIRIYNANGTRYYMISVPATSVGFVVVTPNIIMSKLEQMYCFFNNFSANAAICCFIQGFYV